MHTDQWTNFYDLYVIRCLSTQECAFKGCVDTARYLGGGGKLTKTAI